MAASYHGRSVAADVVAVRGNEQIGSTVTDPLTMVAVALAGSALFVLLGLQRLAKLRRRITLTEEAVAVQRARREGVIAASQGGSFGSSERKELEELEDRIDALLGLQVAQVRAWNRFGDTWPWHVHRALARWQPMSLPEGDERATSSSAGDQPR